MILDSVQFEKNSFTNRNKIKTSTGTTWLTIPVEMKGHLDKNINEIKIDNNINWRKKHWNSILLNYKKAPFFSDYSEFFEHYYSKETDNLADFIETSTVIFLKELGINIPVKKLSEMGITSRKQELIIDMCKATGSNAFIFGALGKNYAEDVLFEKNNISIYFQEYKHPVYEQLWGDFAPYMGIVDALFNLGPQRTREVIFENNITKKELELIFKK